MRRAAHVSVWLAVVQVAVLLDVWWTEDKQ
jgi:hypothetical protein